MHGPSTRGRARLKPLEPLTGSNSRRMSQTERLYRLKNLLDAVGCPTKFEPPGASETSWLTLERDVAHLRDRRTRRSSMTATESPDGLTPARLRRRTARHARGPVRIWPRASPFESAT